MSVTRIVRRQLGWSRVRGRPRRTAAARSLAFALALLGSGAASARASAIEDRNLWAIVSLTGPLLGRKAEASRWRYTFDAPQRFGDDLHQLVRRPGGSDRHNHVLAISLAFSFP